MKSFVKSHSWVLLQTMGVRRLFFQGRAKNFKGGGGTYFLPKKQQKRYYFYQKKSKNILLLACLGRSGGGKSPPLPSPTDAHATDRTHWGVTWNLWWACSWGLRCKVRRIRCENGYRTDWLKCNRRDSFQGRDCLAEASNPLSMTEILKKDQKIKFGDCSIQ